MANPSSRYPLFLLGLITAQEWAVGNLVVKKSHSRSDDKRFMVIPDKYPPNIHGTPATFLPSFENGHADNNNTGSNVSVDKNKALTRMKQNHVRQNNFIAETISNKRATVYSPKREIRRHQTCLSINRLWHELCDVLRRLVGTTAPGHHDCSIEE
ncbi:hypothetical protein TNCV_4423721 [Trichonephila clavipes]|nr:hypothetical protein TNCV_4423721 [Trichonephila clavipes]